MLLGFAAWVLGAGAGRRLARARRFGAVGAAAARLLAALAVLSGIGAAPGAAAAAGDGRRRRGLHRPTRLAALRAEGRPVFVNMTAAWCVTCLVNERVAIATHAGARRLRRATTSPI